MKLLKLTALILLLGVVIFAQQPKVEAPTIYKLNAEASQAFIEIEKAKTELAQKYQALQTQQLALMVGAGIPASERDRPWKPEGEIVTFPPKQQAKTPK